MQIFLYVALVLAVILEGSISQLPLTLIVILCLTILKRDASVFLLAFFAGLFLDIFALRQVGGTSIFFLLYVFLILLYQRKYEIYSYPFVIVASSIGSIIFLSVHGYTHGIALTAVNTGVACMLFASIRLYARRNEGAML